VIRAESGYNSTAVSHAGAGGLMQLMPGTAERYGVRDRFDPAQNLRGGATYLRDLMQMFDDNLPLALAGYNAGENAVINNGYKIPPYAETREYVKRVLQYYAEERLRSGTGSSASVLARQ
jgi:soluble lytic murein transglycosylase-like protein